MSSTQLYKNRDFITNLNKSKKDKSLFKKLIKKSTSGQVKAICELCFNVLRGNLHICKSRKNKLIPHVTMVRYMAKKKIPLYQKKLKLLKGGGLFLSALLPLAISTLSTLFKPST